MLAAKLAGYIQQLAKKCVEVKVVLLYRLHHGKQAGDATPHDTAASDSRG